MNAIVASLIFDGNCKTAMEFYARRADHNALFEMPGDKTKAGAFKDRLTHARIFPFSIGCESIDETKRRFAALSENGSVTNAFGRSILGRPAY
jgi:predicted 3-demethylubiquinone-9 3-methyltransferase (glyoxalase superfamily)